MWIQEEQKMADKETEQIKKLNQTVHSKDTRERDQAYNEYVKQVTPTHNLIFNMVKAFFTGGIICCIGQFILNTCENYGLDKDTSGGWCSMLLILLSVSSRDLTFIRQLPTGAAQGRLCRHRIRKRCSCPGDRVSERGTGFWNRM